MCDDYDDDYSEVSKAIFNWASAIVFCVPLYYVLQLNSGIHPAFFAIGGAMAGYSASTKK